MTYEFIMVGSTGFLAAAPPVERLKIETILFKAERYEDTWPTDNVVKFMVWLHGLIAQVPAEFMANATISIDGHGGYDGDAPQIEVAWWRPETDLEMHDRLRAEADARHQRAEARAAEERRVLAALKAKYEK